MITYADIKAAQVRLGGQSRHTPLLSSPFLDNIAGRKVLVKPECLQHTGSFKFRGAWSAVSALPEEQRKNGVIAFSSGNHAQGVALAAARHGIPAVIIMPKNAPALKIANTRALGAEVVLYDRATEAREDIGDRLSQERNLTLIKPYDEPMVIAGQGTVGLEIATDLPADNAEVLVPCGGGGLTSGISLALSNDAPDMVVRPCEPAGFDDTTRSLTSGNIEQNAAPEGSICDAIVTPAPGEITFPIMKENCGAGIVVTDEDCLRAMAHAFLRLKIVIEPGGAVALAAALFHGDKLTKDTAVCVASGGNVDPSMFARALQTLES
ncbi:threonine ammonia-lyase [Halocynthiibacter namhaensis]|uniref:threonine ammonia-lyase n=1 Tax=Halocynthiibacter namhaensis TaxID=1290553 RepID=UPI0005795F6C|nr:threonine/serine dehydratase [Halocynthiibacter namhaensis]